MQTVKEVKKSGTGAHVTLPKEYLGHRVMIITEDETNPLMRKKDVEKLCNQLIEDAKKGYS